MLKYLRFAIYLGVIATWGCGKGTTLPAVSYVCPANRFITEQFTVMASTVTYTQSTDYQGKTQSLAMDIYEPTIDTYRAGR